MSSPKEKANELVNRFKTEWFIVRIGHQQAIAKHCALIAVEEIILICPYFSKDKADTVEQLRSNDKYFVSYWNEVKNEITKL